jgi:AbrB family looped-hinge helix DNA binding protein
MLTELRPKSQITLPKAVVEKLGLATGDTLDVFERDGTICILPVVVYPRKYLNALNEEINDIKAKIASGEQPVFDSIDAMLSRLEED